MHPPSTLVCLERPWVDAADGDDALRGVAFLMGLRYPGEYWVELALRWAEHGYPLNPAATHELQRIAGSSSKQFSQQLRHRASAYFVAQQVALRPNRALQRTATPPAELQR